MTDSLGAGLIAGVTSESYDSTLHASAAGYLTQEETVQALNDLIKGKGMPKW